MAALWDRLKGWEATASTKEKVLVVIIVILIPLFLFYQFYYIKVKDKINVLKEDIKKLDLEIEKYKQIPQKFKILEVQLNQRREFLEKIKGILPSEKEIPEILKRVSDLTKENNLEVISFRPGKEISQNYYQIIPIEMVLQGGFNNVIKFFNDIESIERLIVLNNATFKMEKKLLNVNATFHTFKYTGLPVEEQPKNKDQKKGETKGE